MGQIRPCCSIDGDRGLSNDSFGGTDAGQGRSGTITEVISPTGSGQRVLGKKLLSLRQVALLADIAGGWPSELCGLQIRM
jgi:hypothetical protein